MPASPADFKAALGRFPAGVTVITVAGAEGDHGMTASAFCSLSLDPPLILVCVHKGNRTHALLEAADGFAVNILAQDQMDLSNRFAGWGPQPEDRFEGLGDTRGPVSGARYLPGAITSLDCTKYGTRDGGDHTIFLGQVEGTVLRGDDADLRPLIYFKGYKAVGEGL
jgi:flavin reductase (DIM6/NTAB) family NADH-FMN oxidoreductase RutF